MGSVASVIWGLLSFPSKQNDWGVAKGHPKIGVPLVDGSGRPGGESILRRGGVWGHTGQPGTSGCTAPRGEHRATSREASMAAQELPRAVSSCGRGLVFGLTGGRRPLWRGLQGHWTLSGAGTPRGKDRHTGRDLGSMGHTHVCTCVYTHTHTQAGSCPSTPGARPTLTARLAQFRSLPSQAAPGRRGDEVLSLGLELKPGGTATARGIKRGRKGKFGRSWLKIMVEK